MRISSEADRTLSPGAGRPSAFTCASLLLAQGVHPRVVMEILGHSQISLTMDTYSHVMPNLQREAAVRMDDLFADTGGAV